MVAQVVDAPPREVMRVLATAYDSNWKLKKIVPGKAIPADRKRLSQLVVPLTDRSDDSPDPKSPACLSRLQTLQVGGQKLGSTDEPFGRQMSEPSRQISKPFSHQTSEPACRSRSMPVSPGIPPKKTKKCGETEKCRKGRGSNAFSEVDFADRPTSAGSEAEEQKRKQDEKKKLVEEEEDVREEKPLAEWAEEAGVPLALTFQALDIFLEFISNPPRPLHRIKRDAVIFGQPFDAGEDLGSMDPEAFGKACCRIADAKDLTSLPSGFLGNAMTSADKDGSGDIDFGEFLYFYYKFSFSEEILISCGERLIRAAAREHNIPYDEIGKYKYIFDQTDTNKNGWIAIDEFKVLINKLLKVPRGEELPEKRIKDLWHEASRETGGKDLDFIGFVGWYKRYFMGDDSYDESPFEAYYHNIRRVSVYDSNLHH